MTATSHWWMYFAFMAGFSSYLFKGWNRATIPLALYTIVLLAQKVIR